jgi:opacity protein-like surface antigen
VLAASATIPIYLTNSASVGYEYIDSKTDQSGGTTGDQGFFSSDSFKVRGHQFTAGASRQLSPITTVGLRGSYALRTGTDETGDEDFQLWNFAVFGRHILPGRLTLDGSVGVTGASSDSSGSVGPNFFTVTSASYQLGRALIALGFDSGFSETFTEGQNFGVVETRGVIGSFSYAITPAISGTLSGSWRRNEPTGIGDASIQSDTTTWTGAVGVSWRIQRRLLLDLTYIYTDHTDNRRTDVTTSGSDGSYTENRVQASLRVVY